MPGRLVRTAARQHGAMAASGRLFARIFPGDSGILVQKSDPSSAKPNNKMYIVRAQFQVLSRIANMASFPEILNKSIRLTDCVEHSHVSFDERTVNVAFFILQPTLSEAEGVAMEICIRCISATDRPSQWRLVQCTADIIGP